MARQATGAVDRRAKVYVAGHHGLADSAIWRHSLEQGFTSLVGASSSEVDLRDRAHTSAFFERERPDVVVDASAKVGGILANSTYPADFPSDNLQIQVNRRQHGHHWISAVPTNVYGPHDNFGPQSSHLLPALIRRLHGAKEDVAGEVVLLVDRAPAESSCMSTTSQPQACSCWRTTTPPTPSTSASAGDVTIRELAKIVANGVGYAGELVQDTTRPDGTLRKLLDVSKIRTPRVRHFFLDGSPELLAPKQDFEAQRICDTLGLTTAAVDADFKFVAGTKPEALRWMRRLSLEWVFRLMSEPHRLWRRDPFGNRRFLMLVLREAHWSR